MGSCSNKYDDVIFDLTKIVLPSTIQHTNYFKPKLAPLHCVIPIASLDRFV